VSADLAAEKAAARKAAAARRAEAHGTQGRVISAYLPIRTEADPLPAMATLAGANRICVPVIEGRGRPLSFREWRPGCRLVEGPFRVMVPEGGAVLVPDLLVVPLLAFDAGLYRLGYGGGFYDRTLAALRAAGACRAVGFAYAAQEVAAVPREATDEPLDELVTERGVRLRR
jgi:5-formyltetrahydrofolate cyclo-ligase